MMPTSGRYLRFLNIDREGPDITARCSACGQEFKSEIKPGEDVEPVAIRIREAYDLHTCDSIH